MPDGRQSYSEGARVRGDRSRRVAVPVPSALRELEGHATHHFGISKSAGMRLHHRGEMLLEADHHLQHVRTGDVIVVDAQKPRGMPLVTTHKTDYPAHKVEPPSRPPQPRSAPKTTPFTAKTHYNDNFQAYQLPSQRQPTPRSAPQPIPFNADSTYHLDYPGHPVSPGTSPRSAARRPRPTVPFEATSTYKQAYTTHMLTPREPPQSQPALSRAPFNGASTYNRDYSEHPLEPRQPQHPKPVTRMPKLPFEADSEYKKSYVEKPLEVPTYVFIEPALRESESSGHA